MQGRPPTRAMGRKQPLEHLGAMRAEHGHSASCAPPRAQPLRPAPRDPDIMQSFNPDAPEDVRVARGLKEALAQCPAKERPKGQQRGGANGAVQGGNNAAAQSGLARVRGAECAPGIMWALRDRLRGSARAVLATSLLHITLQLYG